jgi:3-oxoadipate enol-lactonase
MRLDSLDDLAKDLDRIIDALRVERPVVLGVSFGGAVALQWAVTNPGRVGGLILQGVEARFRPNLGSTITRRVLERFPLPSDNRFLNQFFNLLHGCKPEPGPLVDFVVEQCWQTDQSVVVRRLSALESYDVSDALDVIEAPTLVLAGSRDAIVPARRQQALAAAISSARYVLLEGAGHIGFLTHGEEVVHHVERMLRSTPVSSSSS